MLNTDIGIDLGTATTLIYTRAEGIVLKEPSVIAYDKDTGRIIAVGSGANEMMGRVPKNVVVVKPLSQGVISDYWATEQMLKYFIKKALGKKKIGKYRISICVPCEITEVEKKAVQDVAYQAGAKEVYMVDESVAAAIGAGIDILKPYGSMVIDIGGGTTDIAVISYGGIVLSTSVKVAGNDFDAAIIRHMRNCHNLLIGENTAEKIKLELSLALSKQEEQWLNVSGRDMVTGLPKRLKVTATEIWESLQMPISQIIETVCNLLGRTPPELTADIADRGIVLTGGGGLLGGLDKVLEKATGIVVVTALNPTECVVVGTYQYAEIISK